MFKKSLHKLISRIMLVAVIGQVISSGLLTGINYAKAAGPNDIKINEISARTPTKWVELYNSGNEAVELNNWILQDANETDFGTINTTMQPKSFYVVEKVGTVLNNEGDTVILKNNLDQVIDFKVYSPAPNLPNTLALIPNGDNNWMSARSTKGITNNATLDQPILVDPVNNTYTNINDVVFDWNSVVDPEGDAIHYTISVERNGIEIENEVLDSTSFTIYDLDDGVYKWTVTATDQYGESRVSTENTFTVDTVEPDAILQNELTGSGTVDGIVTLDWSEYSDSDAVSFDILFNGLLIDIATSKSWTSPIDYLVEQTGEFSIIPRDRAGNGSESTTIVVEKGKIVFTDTNNDSDTLLGKNLSVDLHGLYVGVGTATKSDSTINPLPSELKPVGSFWTFLPNDANLENVEGTLKMYFTQAELDASYITDPATQIKGLYAFNEETLAWEAYGTFVYNMLTNDPDGFVGELVVEVEHFSEFVAVADNIAPVAPSGVTVNYMDGKLKISWNRVEGATGYKVYIGTSSDPLLATLVKEVGSNVTQIEQSVQAGKKYFVFIYAVGFNTLLSPASTPFGILVEEVTEPEIVFATAPIVETTTPPSSTPIFTPAPTTPQITPSPEVTPEATTPDEDSSTNKLLIIVIILILAAGAGIGGYYGYLWWQDRNIDDSKPEPIKKASSTPVKSKTKTTSKRKSTRW